MEKINRFTDKFIKNIKVIDKQVEYTEGNGFVLRVSKTGVKSWVYSYSFNRKGQRYPLGRYPSTSIAKARKLYGDALLLKDEGLNPLQVKRENEEAQQAKLKKETQTIEWLANDFYTRYILINRKVPTQIKQIIDSDIIPSLGSIKLEDITTRHITIALEEIVDRGANVQANHTLSTIKQMFTYAISKGIIERNPAILINSKNIGGVKRARTRSLSLFEIKKIWTWLDNKNNHCLFPTTVLALKILILTGVRSNEIRLAEWSEIDFDNSLWTIPAEKYKTGIEHKVYLTDFTIQHFKELKELCDNNCMMVLPLRNDNTKPMVCTSLPRAVRRIRPEIKGVENWTPHDLRRTFRTQLGAIGILPHIAERCLGHKPPKIEFTYDTYDYLDERKEALKLWSEKVEMLVTNNNVVLLNTQTK